MRAVLQKLYQEGGNSPRIYRRGEGGGVKRGKAFLYLSVFVADSIFARAGRFMILSMNMGSSGIARLYQGLFPWAIFQAPLSRFGDVASNDMVLALMGALFPQDGSSQKHGFTNIVHVACYADACCMLFSALPNVRRCTLHLIRCRLG